MKKKNVIFLLVLIILIIPLISSQLVTLGNFKLNQDVLIKQVCSDATYINISVSNPNSQNVVSNVSMAYDGSGIFYYTFNQTNILGRYDVYGISDGCEKTFATYFIIGTKLNEPSLEGIILIIFLLVVSFCVGYGSYLLLKNHKETMGQKEDNYGLYKLKQTNTLGYYWQIIKRNAYIAGYFGIYISLLLFVAILNDALYSIEFVELSTITQYTFILLGWGLIPFCIVWLIYIIFAFYQTVEKALKYQLGGLRNERS